MAEVASFLKRKRPRSLFYAVAALLVLTAVAGAIAYLLIRNQQLANLGYTSSQDAAADTDPIMAGTSPAADPNAAPSRHVYAPLDTFTANLADGDRERFAQVSLVIELGTPKTEQAFKAVMPVIRSEILLLLTSKRAEDLMTLSGKQTLAQQIVDICRKYIDADYRDQVYAAHFAGFVIQ